MSTGIRNKTQMYELLLAGKLGNRVRAWDGLKALEASGYRGQVSLRSKNIADPVAVYHVPYEMLHEVLDANHLCHRTDIVYSESPPDEMRVIQGELTRSPYCGLFFKYTFAPLPMRSAFDQGSFQYAEGLRAKLLLEHYVDPSSLDDLYELLDEYPDHVIEFSSFAVPVGVLGRLAVIWECRLY